MKDQQSNKPLLRCEIPSAEVYDNLREVSNGFYLDLGIFTVAILRDEWIVKLIDSVYFSASFLLKIKVISHCIGLFGYLNKEEVIPKYKKNKENELYKNSIIAKVEVNLSNN
jgi:hypothetical protein